LGGKGREVEGERKKKKKERRRLKVERGKKEILTVTFFNLLFPVSPLFFSSFDEIYK